MRVWARVIVDLLAVAVLAAYGWSVHYARQGAADPTWTAITGRGVIRVGTDPGFRPFAEEQNGEWSGYDVDLMSEIGRRLGVRVTFQAVSYDALYDTLAAGEVDVLASALPLAPAQGWRARFSSAYLNAGQVLVVRAGSAIEDESDLPGHVVAAALGTEGDTLLRGLRRLQPAITARSDFDTADSALAALQRGDVEAVITDAVSALSLTEADRRFVIARGLTFEPYVLAMPVGAYQLQANIDRILEALGSEGFIERLNTRWFAGLRNATGSPGG